jgi:hypothetical protein
LPFPAAANWCRHHYSARQKSPAGACM